MSFLKSDKKYTYGKQSISYSDIWGVIKTLRSPWLTQGPKVKEFEDAICSYTGAKYAVAVANGTAALHIAVLSIGFSDTDELITSPITFLASANCALLAGGHVTFADIEEDTACINPAEIIKKINSNTKIIIPVHFAGQSCNMKEIHSIAKKHNFHIIEDAAHAIGSEYEGEKIGSCRYSDMTIFSFHPVKTITTGEGGAITTNNRDIYEKLLMLRSHGITRNVEKYTCADPGNDGTWYHEMQILGYNYRLTDIQAALGVSQMKRLPDFIKRRREIVMIYREAFENSDIFTFLTERKFSNAAFHLFPLLIDFSKIKTNRKTFMERLSKRGLNLQVHYIPVHLQPYYRKFGFKEGDYPHAEMFYNKTISLPLYPKLSDRDVYKIIQIIKRSVN